MTVFSLNFLLANTKLLMKKLEGLFKHEWCYHFNNFSGVVVSTKNLNKLWEASYYKLPLSQIPHQVRLFVYYFLEDE